MSSTILPCPVSKIYTPFGRLPLVDVPLAGLSTLFPQAGGEPAPFVSWCGGVRSRPTLVPSVFERRYYGRSCRPQECDRHSRSQLAWLAVDHDSTDDHDLLLVEHVETAGEKSSVG